MANLLDRLGEFEQMVLLAVMASGDQAYAVPVRQEIERISSRSVSRGAVYVTLDRLVEKGYLASQLGDATPERGGRPKRFYNVTPLAVRTLKESRRVLELLWSAADATLGRT